MRARWFGLASGAAILLAFAAPQESLDLYFHDVYVVLAARPLLTALAALLAAFALFYRWLGRWIARAAHRARPR